MHLLLALIVVVFMFAQLSFAQPATSPTTVLDATDPSTFGFSGGGQGLGERTVVHVDGQPFEQAVQVRTIRKPAIPWELQLTAETSAAVAKNDVLTISFYGRATQVQAETGEATTEVVFERAGTPWEKSAEKPFGLTKEWTRHVVSFRSVDAYPAGGAHVCLRAGYNPQTIEIGGLQIVNHGLDADLRKMPGSISDYPGRAPDAPWRAAAAERIERLRKADLTVVVTDGDGKPVPGATVKVDMKRHAFPFGSAVVARRLTDDSPEHRIYQRKVKELFNAVVFENDLKWNNWEQPGQPDRVRAALDWLDANGIQARGHVLVWPGWGPESQPTWKYLPDDLRKLADEKPEGWQDRMRQRVYGRVTDTVTALRGRLVDWDVINETWSNHVLMDLLGKQEMVEWFKRARAADPGVKLYYNDYTMLSGGATDPSRIEHLYQTIKYLQDNGAPIDGIGEQGHFGNTVTPPERMLQILDRFAAFGLPIRITEFDVNTSDAELQADYTRDFYTAAFSHPSVNGILMWGFWEGAHWMPAAAMYRKDWAIKPNGEAYRDLVFRQWWTNASGSTDDAGKYATRGFHGDYEITVTAGQKTQTVRAKLVADGATINITLR